MLAHEVVSFTRRLRARGGLGLSRLSRLRATLDWATSASTMLFQRMKDKLRPYVAAATGEIGLVLGS